MHDGRYKLNSLGVSPITLEEAPYLTAYRAYKLLVLDGASSLPQDMAVWHRNYTVNDTFRTQDIGTFKEAHCEIKKCDVNTFAAVGGQFYVSKPAASL